MKIKKGICNLSNFRLSFLRKYSLSHYQYNNYDPVIIFGCYGEKQISDAINIARFSPMVVICWAGGDIKILTELIRSDNPVRGFWVDVLRGFANIRHIAISKWICEDLDFLGLPYKYVPVTPMDYSMIEPCEMGESIYMYCPESNIYTGGIYHKIKSRIPFNIIEANYRTYYRNDLLKIYEKCFLGLRFTDHDGLSNTVCEMGLMGRNIIHNGITPNSIHFDKNDINGIVDMIIQEYENRNQVEAYAPDAIYNYQVISGKMKNFLNIGDDFLNTEYYD